MTAEVAILERLKADTAVAAIVSRLPEGRTELPRVYQLKLPQKPTLPAIRVQLISEPADLHLRGVSSLFRSRIQVDAFAHESDANNPDPYGTVTELADAIDGALHGRAFDSSDSPLSVRVLVCQRESRMPLYDANELRQVRVVQDFYVWWRKMDLVMS